MGHGGKRPLQVLIKAYCYSFLKEMNCKDMNEKVCGIYVLYKNDIPVYVGKSINVKVRVMQHRMSKDFDRWDYKSCNADDLNRLELETIHRLRPGLNVAPDFDGKYNVKKIVVAFRPFRSVLVDGKRPLGRPPQDISFTSAERSKARRMRGFKSVQLPPDVVISLRTLRDRDGDPTDALAIKRAVNASLGLPMP